MLISKRVYYTWLIDIKLRIGTKGKIEKSTKQASSTRDAAFGFLIVRHSIPNQFFTFRHVFIQRNLMFFRRCGREARRCNNKLKKKKTCRLISFTLSMFNITQFLHAWKCYYMSHCCMAVWLLKHVKIHLFESSMKVDVWFTYFGTRFYLVCESFFSFIFMVPTTSVSLCYFHWNSIKKTTFVSTSSWVGEDNKTKDMYELNTCMIVSIMEATN